MFFLSKQGLCFNRCLFTVRVLLLPGHAHLATLLAFRVCEIARAPGVRFPYLETPRFVSLIARPQHRVQSQSQHTPDQAHMCVLCHTAARTTMQWVQCDVRAFQYEVFGKFEIIMADPPWDIHMELPYDPLRGPLEAPFRPTNAHVLPYFIAKWWYGTERVLQWWYGTAAYGGMALPHMHCPICIVKRCHGARTYPYPYP